MNKTTMIMKAIRTGMDAFTQMKQEQEQIKARIDSKLAESNYMEKLTNDVSISWSRRNGNITFGYSNYNTATGDEESLTWTSTNPNHKYLASRAAKYLARLYLPIPALADEPTKKVEAPKGQTSKQKLQETLKKSKEFMEESMKKCDNQIKAEDIGIDLEDPSNQ